MIDIEKFDRQLAADDALLARVNRLVDRLVPITPKSFHGFYEQEQFIEKARVSSVRRRLHLYLKAKLRAKRDGHELRLRYPKNADHLYYPGEAMFDVSAFIEAQKAHGGIS